MFVSAEWLRSIAVAVPALLLAWWTVWGVGWLWRRILWARVGAAARELAGADGEIRPLWAGWRVQVGDLRVDWRGGLLGPRTVVRKGDRRRRLEGLVDAATVRTAASD